MLGLGMAIASVWQCMGYEDRPGERLIHVAGKLLGGQRLSKEGAKLWGGSLWSEECRGSSVLGPLGHYALCTEEK